MENTQSVSATPAQLRRRLTSARLVLGLSAPLALTMVLAFATNAAADHETGQPGPPTLACQCTTNPVVLMWVPDTRRVAQPTLYRMSIGTRPGQEDIGVFDMGLNTQWTAIATPGVSYYVRIAGVNALGGNYSNEVVISVPNVTTPVLSGTLNGRDLTLRWTASPTAILYVSYSASFTTYATVAVSGNVAPFSNVAPGVYYFILWNGTQWSNILPAIVQ
jgi:hypothetical protein